MESATLLSSQPAFKGPQDPDVVDFIFIKETWPSGSGFFTLHGQTQVFYVGSSLVLSLYCERRLHGIFGWIFLIRTRMYFRSIRPLISKTNFTLRALIFHASAALVTKFYAI